LKINEDLLEIIPINPLLAKEHMDLCREGKGDLDNHLELGDLLTTTKFKKHAKLLAGFYRLSPLYPTFMVMYGKKLVGIFRFSPPKYIGGVQLIYYIRKGFQGKGIASFALKHISQIAFYTHKYLHIELHIDVDNLASKKVAEKAGFDSRFDYVDAPIGVKGSGNMEVYTLVNKLSQDYVRQIPREEWMENEDWVPGGRNFTTRTNNQPNRKQRRLNKRR
jgi:hypothetical protein